MNTIDTLKLLDELMVKYSDVLYDQAPSLAAQFEKAISAIKQALAAPVTDTEQINSGCWYKTALTAAQPAPYVASPRVPLTEPELRAVLEKTNHMITNTMCGPFWPELEQACRAIEAAHGITKGQP